MNDERTLALLHLARMHAEGELDEAQFNSALEMLEGEGDGEEPAEEDSAPEMARKAWNYLDVKAGPPGTPPRPGLTWREETHRWVREDGGEYTDDSAQSSPEGQEMPEGPEKPTAADAAEMKPFATPDQLMAGAREYSPRQIAPVNVVGHSPVSDQNLNEIAVSMEENGWQGPPLLAMKREDNWQGLTGSHRLAAADRAGIGVPAVFISHEDILEWAAKAGYELEPDADLTDLEDEDRLAIVLAGDNPLAKEIMRQELAKPPAH